MKVINLKHEYTGYIDDVYWPINRNLSEQELREKYTTLIGQYEPFLLPYEEHARIMVNLHSDECKYKKRNAKLEKLQPELARIYLMINPIWHGFIVV